jgi:hypothetical protein
MSRRRKALIAALIVALALLCPVLCWLLRPSPPAYEPSAGIYEGADVIAVEDFASAVAQNTFIVSVAAPYNYYAIPVWGGWSPSGNITIMPVIVNLADAGGPNAYLLIFGVASRNATIDQYIGHGFSVYAGPYGGYVAYNNSLAVWCLRPPVLYNNVYVWLPASACGISAKYVVRVTPSWGIVSINTIPVRVYNLNLVKVKGVLPGWLVFANHSGTYYITVPP